MHGLEKALSADLLGERTGVSAPVATGNCSTASAPWISVTGTPNVTDNGRTQDGDGTRATTDVDLIERVEQFRDRISALSDPDGTFIVACRESGHRPEPVRDARFENYADAEVASELARRYRAAMRTVDPSLARYGLTVSKADEGSVALVRVREHTDERRENGLPRARQTVTLAGNGSDEWLRVENGPVVQFTGPDSLLDDEFVTRQLDSKLAEKR